jgi:hydroxymethylglutaryl-CoA reductase
MDTTRDIVIILLSVIGTMFFAVLIVSLVWIAFSVKALITDVKVLVDDEVKPTLRSVREGVNSMRGAATVAGSVGVNAAGGNTAKAISLAMGARRVMNMVRNRGK